MTDRQGRHDISFWTCAPEWDQIQSDWLQ